MAAPGAGQQRQQGLVDTAAAVLRLGDALRPDFNANASLFTIVLTCLLFGLLFAALRRPR